MDGKIRYLEMIETVSARMATNSFSLKGWTVSKVNVVESVNRVV